MNYTLVVITHGDAPTLPRTIESFWRHVTPSPDTIEVFADGPASRTDDVEWDVLHVSDTPQGFCRTYEHAWRAVVESEFANDYVLWLENDFQFVRDVYLPDLALVLDAHPVLAQMALMRDAVSQEEKAAGGLYESRHGQYTPQRMLYGESDHNDGWLHWLEHASYFTTNPSLMTAEFMRRNPWPDYEARCEGLFGIDLLERGYRFGVWGDGSPWVRHIGERTGFGY